MSKMPAKKKSCFQITSVIQAQVGAGGAADDTESLDDPDESRTEGGSSEIFDVSRADFDAEACDRSSSEEALNNVGEAEAGQQRQSQAPGAAGPGPQPVTSCSSRFRVIKLDHGTGEPFRRGRWTCTEFYDKEPEVTVITGRTSDGVKHANEHLAERDSGLGASGAPPQCGQAGGDVVPIDPGSAHPFEPGNESKTGQPPHTLLHAPGHNGVGVQMSPVSPQLYQNQPLTHHVQGQTPLVPSPNLEYGQHLSLPLKVPGEMGMSIPGSQSGPSPNLVDWAGVMSSVPLAAAASIQLGQYSGMAMVAAQNSPTSGAGGVPMPEESRRKSDAAGTIPVKEVGKAEEPPLAPNPGVNSLFGITIPIDGDEESASGASVVAIDNKIEQAMDLVKSHLMYAVREEVEVLKEQIKELCERNSVLERENAVLKSLANSEQLSQLTAHAAPTGAAALPSSNPAQPSVSSA